MRRELTTLAAAVVLTACGTTYETALQIEFEGEVASSGGGYWVELAGADGAAIEGLNEPSFVRFVKGEQIATLVVDAVDLFEESDTFEARLHVAVTADSNEDSTALSKGSVQLKLQGGQVTTALVELLPPPGSVPGALTARLDDASGAPAGTNVQIHWDNVLAAPVGFTLAVGVRFDDDNGNPVWHGLGALDPSVPALQFNAQFNEFSTPLLARSGLDVVITVEPIEGEQAFARSNGFAVFEGASSLAAEVASTLLPAIQSMFSFVEAHAGFANAAADAVGERDHGEHVYNVLSGSSAQGDLNGVGGITYSGFADKMGMVFYVGELFNAFEAAGGSGAGFTACRDATLAAILNGRQTCCNMYTGACPQICIDEGFDCSTPADCDGDCGQQLVDDLEAIEGDPYDESAATGQSLACFRTLMLTFDLDPL